LSKFPKKIAKLPAGVNLPVVWQEIPQYEPSLGFEIFTIYTSYVFFSKPFYTFFEDITLLFVVGINQTSKVLTGTCLNIEYYLCVFRSKGTILLLFTFMFIIVAMYLYISFNMLKLHLLRFIY